VIDKFTCDALIENMLIHEDNWKVIKEVVYRIGEMDKVNSRCELTIESIVR
jgi:hypothetical protein